MDIDSILQSALTPDQFLAAKDKAPEVLAIACAGSGKSRTLAYRIARLLSEGNPPSGIVAFTFTEKAAEAIKLRAASALTSAGLDPTAIGAMYIGTIHSYCQHILGQMDARYRQFDVLDDNRLVLYLISRYPEIGLQLLAANFAGGRYFAKIRAITEAWKTVNDEMISLAQVLYEDPALGQVLSNIDTLLTRDQFIDFSLMIRRVAEALQQGVPDALRAVSGLEHLMVDEYQDVNPSQEALIRELHRVSETLFVVGDDDQAIYAWRGADVNNILQFSERYPNCSEQTLSTNFRSTPAIVQAADDFAAAELGATRLSKDPVAPPFTGPRDFRKLWFDDRDLEADWVGQRIASLLGSAYVEQDGSVRGLTPADFAILMRSTRQSEGDGAPRHAAFTSALLARSIPFTLEAGGSIFDRPQVAVLRDTFELLRNGTPSRQEARAHFDSVVLSAYPSANFNLLAQVLTEWGRLIHSPAGGPRRRVYPQQLVHDLLAAFDLPGANFDVGVMRDIGVFSRIIQDVEAVYLSIDSAMRFQQILNFLQNIADSGYDTGTDEILRRPDAVTVSTVHKVKGLEYPVVFVVDVEAQRFPRNRSSYEGCLPTSVIQAAVARGAYQSTRSEEARLFYTALTRGERFLYVTGAARLPGGSQIRRPSPFTLRLAHPELSDQPAGLPAGLLSATPARRIDETVMPTSYSDIRYYLRCPRDYQLRKGCGFSPPISEMFGFGKTVHSAVGKLHEQFIDRPPTADEAEGVARDVFHLKHVPQSRDPVNRPGAFEAARDRSGQIAREYVSSYTDDFVRSRQTEARFEIPVTQAVISGAIDLLLQEDEAGNIVDADVIDFKTMEGGDEPEERDDLAWTELALQVQLYAKAAREVLGENARTGSVHMLKDNQRLQVPVTDEAINAAVANVEWAVGRILSADFPMRPERTKCSNCDFVALCSKQAQSFQVSDQPPAIHVPGTPARRMARAFSEFQP